MDRNFWSLLCIYWYTVKIQSEAQVFPHNQQPFNTAWCWPFCTFPSLPVSPWPSFHILWPVSVHPPTSQWVPWWTWTVAWEYPEWKNHIYIPQWNFHLHKEYMFFFPLFMYCCIFKTQDPGNIIHLLWSTLM